MSSVLGPYSPRARQLRRQVAVLHTAKAIFDEHGDRHLATRMDYYTAVLNRAIARGGDHLTSDVRILRRYQTMPGYWGLGFSKSPGHWAFEVGPWVFTTEPDLGP